MPECRNLEAHTNFFFFWRKTVIESILYSYRADEMDDFIRLRVWDDRSNENSKAHKKNANVNDGVASVALKITAWRLYFPPRMDRLVIALFSALCHVWFICDQIRLCRPFFDARHIFWRTQSRKRHRKRKERPCRNLVLAFFLASFLRCLQRGLFICACENPSPDDDEQRRKRENMLASFLSE